MCVCILTVSLTNDISTKAGPGTEHCPDISRLQKLLVFLIYFFSDTGWLAGWLAGEIPELIV